MNLSNKEQAAEWLKDKGFFANWMPRGQRQALILSLRGEEGEYFVRLLRELKDRIEKMPKTYETESVATHDKVFHLHYFRGNVDGWIIEKDKGDGTDDLSQYQAYGKATLYGEKINDAEWGYISIQEYIENGVELDLHFEPSKIGGI